MPGFRMSWRVEGEQERDMGVEVEEVGRRVESPGWGQPWEESWWRESHTYKVSLLMEQVVERMEAGDSLVAAVTTVGYGGVRTHLLTPPYSTSILTSPYSHTPVSAPHSDHRPPGAPGAPGAPGGGRTGGSDSPLPMVTLYDSLAPWLPGSLALWLPGSLAP